MVFPTLEVTHRFSGRYRYLVKCEIPRGFPENQTMIVVTEMRRNQALADLREGEHFFWEGATKIAFTRKKYASLYKIFVDFEKHVDKTVYAA